MNKTQNYQLNQWEATDKVQRIDFNADNAKIDAALTTEAQAREALATRTEAVAASVPKIAAGTYTGDGAASRTIPLPFTPKAVFVCTRDGCTSDGRAAVNQAVYGGLAVTGNPVVDTRGQTAVELLEGGFRVFVAQYHISGQSYYNVNTNLGNTVYHYLAIG